MSQVADFTENAFAPVLPDPGNGGRPLDDDAVRRVLLCSGKVFYDLLAHRESQKVDDVAIVRVEQLYPLCGTEIEEALERYPNATDVVWVQEEPANMGAWPRIRLRFGERLLGRWPLMLASRPESASPATGSAASHKLEQARVLAEAFCETIGECE